MARMTLLDETGVVADKVFAGQKVGLIGNFAAYLLAKNVDRAEANELYDVIIEESPSDEGIPDAQADWFLLVTFAQIAAGPTATEKVTVTVPRAGRMRVAVTLAGTTPSFDPQVILEGVGEG